MSKAKAKSEPAKKGKAAKSELVERKPVTWRYKAVVSLMLGVATFLSYRALSIQVLDNDFLQTQGDARHLRTIDLPAHRGMLLDRNGEVLALSSPVTTVWADPEHTDINDAGLAELSRLIDVPLKTLKQQIQAKSGKEFVYLKRHLHPAVSEKVKALNIPGVSTLREFRRFYPAAEVTSHVVGVSDIDQKGLEGFELQANEKLRGVAGKDRVLKDRRGRIVNSVDLMEEPQPGQDVVLSIDKRLQYIAYRELKKAVKLHNAKTASVVLLDANNGEVLALANIPSYNPNSLTKRDEAFLRNRAVTDLIEPGSTIKPFIVAAALETKQINANFSINTSPGYMRVGNATIKDVRNYGELDITGIIRKSSNIGVTKIALNMPPEMLWEKLSDMGFGELTRSQFPGERVGVLPFFGEWRPINQATLSYGYGLSVTPLQLAQAYTIFANDGILNPVSLEVKNGIVRGQRVVSSDVADNVLRMMETVVSREGTAWEAHIPGYRVAGKTGTVKKAKNGGYADDQYLALFAGIAPVSDPKFVCVVLVDEPRNEHYYGGKVAAPVFAGVMSEALRLLNIPPDDLKPANIQMASTAGGAL